MRRGGGRGGTELVDASGVEREGENIEVIKGVAFCCWWPLLADPFREGGRGITGRVGGSSGEEDHVWEGKSNFLSRGEERLRKWKNRGE